MFSIGISVLSCIFIKNKILMLILSIIFFSTVFYKKNKKVQILTLFLVVFNSFCGKLTLFCKILLFFDIFLWITRELSKKDLLLLFSDFSDNRFYRKMIIFILIFPRLFLNNYNNFDFYFESKNLICDLKKIFCQSSNDLKRIYIEFEKRLFFTKKVYFHNYINNCDLTIFLVSLFIFCFSIVL